MCFYHVSKYHPYGCIGMKGPHVRCFGSQKDLVNSYDHSSKDLMGSAVWVSKDSDLDVLVLQLEERLWPVCGNVAPLNKEACLYAVPSHLDIFSMIVRVVHEISSTSCASFGDFSRGVRLNPWSWANCTWRTKYFFSLRNLSIDRE